MTARKALSPYHDRKAATAPGSYLGDGRIGGDHSADAGDSQCDQDGVTQYAQRGHGQMVVPANSLGQNKSVLRPDGDYQSAAHAKTLYKWCHKFFGSAFARVVGGGCVFVSVLGCFRVNGV